MDTSTHQPVQQSVAERLDPHTATTPLGDWVRELCDAPDGGNLLSMTINVIIIIIAICAFSSLTAMVLVWMERKLAGRFQRRLGPTRTGPFGLLQTAADGLKLFLKEGFRPNASDPFTYYLAPLLPLTGAFMVLAVIPFGPSMWIADPELGLIFISAIAGLGVLALLIGSWGSNNKYSLMGGLRAGAQAISYEVSLILCFLLIVLASGETNLLNIVEGQQGNFWNWWIIKLPGAGFIAFIFFIITSTAELNRTPFDTTEAESELTGGFHTEYSGIAFSMFFLAEYVHMFIAAAIGATLFLGGYNAPFEFLPDGWWWLMAKSYAIIFLYIWFRWTFPRLRIDQLMALEWKFLLPLSLINLVFAGILIAMGWIL